MPFIDYSKKNTVKIWDGIHGQLHHTQQLTCGRIYLKAGVELPEHHHVHEQWTHVLEGELEFRIGEEVAVLKAGMCACIPSNIPHSGRALTDCVALDVFSPYREDFVAKEKEQFPGA
ncbi:MAG: cupin domain-containing protein [Bacteroidetes bacterium]|nr:cupin domain-containing protein [Bacteroidota bacterium]